MIFPSPQVRIYLFVGDFPLEAGEVVRIGCNFGGLANLGKGYRDVSGVRRRHSGAAAETMSRRPTAGSGVGVNGLGMAA